MRTLDAPGVRLSELVEALPLGRSSVFEVIKALEIRTSKLPGEKGQGGGRVAWLSSVDADRVRSACHAVHRGEMRIAELRTPQIGTSGKALDLDLAKATLPDAIASLVDAWLAAQDVQPVQQPQRREPRQYDPNEPQVRFTVDLPKSLHKRLKQAAINHERPMTDMARDALADWLDMSEDP